MANPLDRKYAQWALTRSDDDLNALMKQVNVRSRKLTGDEDVVQDIALVILEALPKFKPAHDNAFQNFHSRTCKNRRLWMHTKLKKESNHDTDIEIIVPDEESPRDYSQFTDSERKLIKLLEMGFTLADIAGMLGLKLTVVQRITRAMKGRI